MVKLADHLVMSDFGSYDGTLTNSARANSAVGGLTSGFKFSVVRDEVGTSLDVGMRKMLEVSQTTDAMKPAAAAAAANNKQIV